MESLREKGEGKRKGEPGEGKERRKGDGRDKSPTWSSQDFGSTVFFVEKVLYVYFTTTNNELVIVYELTDVCV